ncbi:AAA ATPase domain-containing protein [Aeromonas veronii]|uniref:AAA ATPase domain-containing protein n=1 Tax=Aeromonas veronii TaxID=654 RepID=A0A653KY96_AERVE|nr:ATP-binding protein [Aeromonas veronii]VXA83519.1 AAA ATPase domain-containing protein [Aeromonas veronii]
MKIQINKAHKSIPAGVSFELPTFSVITGKNGSGKSHLLEAMANSQISTVSDGKNNLAKVLLIGFGGLNPQIDEACDPQQITQNTKNWWGQIEQYQRNLINVRNNGEQISGPIEHVLSRWGHNPQLFSIINSVTQKTGKTFEQLSEDDIYFNLNISQANSGTLFASQLALIFKTYHVRYTKNKFKKFLNQENNTNIPTLSDEEFSRVYGPKPWVLVNEILAKAGLTYEVVNPEAIDTESTYRLRLVDRDTGTEISANDLSTGEKVLMSLALAIYNTQESSGKPDVLILDEPDAPLHPQYSRLLIETLRDIVVSKAGVQVVITTHSPSTVAMCPDNSLFEISRDTKKPEMVSISRGLEVLTDGIPHLKISTDDRRQIFVESKLDVIYFQRLHQIISRFSTIGYTPIFLEPHSGTSNCTDVQSIANRLHESGSDLVRGIIDWDGKNIDKHPIYVLGGGNRYAIENYVLDPLFLGLALVRLGKRRLSDFSIPHIHTYIDAAKVTNEEAQRISDYITQIAGISNASTADCELHNGWVLKLPTEFLMMRGHDWETSVLSCIPELNAICSRNGDAGLKLGIMQVIEEYPQFLSTDISRTLLALK